MVVKILKYEFSNFWWDFKVASLLAWPGYLPITLDYLISVMALAQNGRTWQNFAVTVTALANCRYVTRGLYITLSGAAALLLSFL